MRHLDFLYACLGGILLGIGFLIPALWWVSLTAFAPFLYAISRAGSRRRVFVLGFLFGFVAYGLSYYPVFWHSLPLSWLGITDGWTQTLVIFLFWSTTAILYAIPAGLFGIAVRTLMNDTWRDVLLVASLWTIADWLGAWLFSIVNAAPEMLYGPHFTLGSFGYLLAGDSVLVQGAWLGGLFALNAIIAGSGAFLFRFLSTRSSPSRSVLAGLFGLLCVLWIGASFLLRATPASSGASGPAITIAAISAQVPPTFVASEDELDARFERNRELVSSITDADVILLPEGSRFLRRLHTENRSSTDFLSPQLLTRTEGPLIVDSAAGREADGKTRSLIEYRDVGASRSQYAHKQFLAPYSEVQSTLFNLLAQAVGEKGTLEKFLRNRAFARGTPQQPMRIYDTSISTLLCSESVSPLLYRAQVRAGAEILTSLSSYAWFHGSEAMQSLGIRVATVRAVESRRSFVLSGNVIPSFAIDPYGRLIAEAKSGTEGVLYVKAYPRRDMTPFTILGGWVLLLPAGILGWIVWNRRKNT